MIVDKNGEPLVQGQKVYLAFHVHRIFPDEQPQTMCIQNDELGLQLAVPPSAVEVTPLLVQPYNGGNDEYENTHENTNGSGDSGSGKEQCNQSASR